MARQIKAAAIQFTLQLGNIDANVAQVESAVAKVAAEGAQLVVLPEMWSTGFALKELNELAIRTQETVEEMGRISWQHDLVLVGSLPEPDGDRVCNTAYIMDRGRLVGKYRKIHLFSLMREDRYFSGGDSWLVVDTSAGRIGVCICYDLRFPELTRRLAVEGTEILVVPGEWPKPRDEHWRQLLKARAIENQFFVVAANACGVVGKLDFFGSSMIIGPKGEILAEGGYEPAELVAELNFADMTAWREQIPTLADRRPECY